MDSIEDIAGPALLLDRDALDRNIQAVAKIARGQGVAWRPHVKAHKCSTLGRLLIAAGAIGQSCATLREAETMAAAGIGGILLTSPLATPAQFERLAKLLRSGADVSVVADDARAVDPLAGVARGAGTEIGVLVDVDVGQNRTGVRDIAQAVVLAGRVQSTKGLRYDGVQVYYGHLQQTVPMSERATAVGRQHERIADLLQRLRQSDAAPRIVTGSGSGTSLMDARSGLFTELQPGSAFMMDASYSKTLIGADGTCPFEVSLFVQADIISATGPGLAVVNAGTKALATDAGLPMIVGAEWAGWTYAFSGDEHGVLGARDGVKSSAPWGRQVRLVTPHCDPTVNLYDRFHVIRGENVVDTWAIDGRGY